MIEHKAEPQETAAPAAQHETSTELQMIEDFTIDYDRVHSSTATIDGERIVLTLHTANGATNISLPASEVPRLIAAISSAAGMGKEAYTGNPTHLAFAVGKIEVRTRKRTNRVLLVVDLLGGPSSRSKGGASDCGPMFKSDRPDSGVHNGRATIDPIALIRSSQAAVAIPATEAPPDI